jgi:transcription initiation factor IIE alpha subunit
MIKLNLNEITMVCDGCSEELDTANKVAFLQCPACQRRLVEKLNGYTTQIADLEKKLDAAMAANAELNKEVERAKSEMLAESVDNGALVSDLKKQIKALKREARKNAKKKAN